MAIVSGGVTGTLGFTNTSGFLVFAILYSIVSVALLTRMDFDVRKFLPATDVKGFLLDGILGHAMSFLLFWTLSFALVHIY